MWRACPGGQYCADVSGLVTGNCTAGYYCVEVGFLYEGGQSAWQLNDPQGSVPRREAIFAEQLRKCERNLTGD